MSRWVPFALRFCLYLSFFCQVGFGVQSISEWQSETVPLSTSEVTPARRNKGFNKRSGITNSDDRSLVKRGRLEHLTESSSDSESGPYASTDLLRALTSDGYRSISNGSRNAISTRGNTVGQTREAFSFAPVADGRPEHQHDPHKETKNVDSDFSQPFILNATFQEKQHDRRQAYRLKSDSFSKTSWVAQDFHTSIGRTLGINASRNEDAHKALLADLNQYDSPEETWVRERDSWHDEAIEANFDEWNPADANDDDTDDNEDPAFDEKDEGEVENPKKDDDNDDSEVDINDDDERDDSDDDDNAAHDDDDDTDAQSASENDSV